MQPGNINQIASMTLIKCNKQSIKHMNLPGTTTSRMLQILKNLAMFGVEIYLTQLFVTIQKTT